MRLEVIDIEKLRSNSGQIEGLPANPRKWDANDVKRLAKSIEETPELLEARKRKGSSSAPRRLRDSRRITTT